MKFWQSRHKPQCKLSQKDLIDISEAITQTYAPFDTHHQPELVLMPVDPIHLYAYWNLKGYETHDESSHVGKQLALRIYSIPELSENTENLQLSFDIKVYGFRHQQKVHLPVAATAYSAVVGEINADSSFSPLAVSETIHVPREYPVSNIKINANENRVHINNAQENNSTNSPNPKQTPTFSHPIKNNFDSLPFDPKMNKSIDANTQKIQQPDAFILKNFNDYGYDLKIYKNGFTVDFTHMLSKQNIPPHISEIKPVAIDKNTSGQGRLI